MTVCEPQPPRPPVPCARQCWYRRIGCIEAHTHVIEMGQDGGWQDNVTFVQPDNQTTYPEEGSHDSDARIPDDHARLSGGPALPMTAERLILQGASTLDSSLAGAAVFDAIAPQSLVHLHFPMQNNGWNVDLPDDLIRSLWAKGQLTMVSWGSFDLGRWTAWKASDVLAGVYDAYLLRQAALLKRLGMPVMLVLDCEMNGPWEPWYTDGPSFVALWQHIFGTLWAAGAANATAAWVPNQVGTSGSLDYRKLNIYYPGDKFVHWAGMDVYNKSTPAGMPWLTWDQTARGGLAGVGDTYGTVASIAGGKPIVIGEFNSDDHPGNKAAWLTQALNVIASDAYSQVYAISLFNVVDKLQHWPLQPGSAEARAYAYAVKDDPYVLARQFPMPPLGKPLGKLQRTMTPVLGWA